VRESSFGMHALIDLFLHLDKHLADVATAYGPWVYGILFLIVFAETGLVVTPFLPGDSLLFACGALAATGILDGPALVLTLVAAAIVGNAVNYQIGRIAGPRIFAASDRRSFWNRLLNEEHLADAHAFFERHGGRAVVLARFVPIVRTFVPFVAGAGAMTYRTFAIYNVVGCVLWVGLCLGGGYAFGNVPMVRNNFSLVAVGIVAVSLTPMAIELFRRRRRRP
jgi:membrane-associated protein